MLCYAAKGRMRSQSPCVRVLYQQKTNNKQQQTQITTTKHKQQTVNGYQAMAGIEFRQAQLHSLNQGDKALANKLKAFGAAHEKPHKKIKKVPDDDVSEVADEKEKCLANFDAASRERSTSG